MTTANSARTPIDQLAQANTAPAGHGLDLRQRIHVLEEILRSYVNGDLNPGNRYTLILDLPDHATQNLDYVLPIGVTVIGSRIAKTSVDAGANANTVQVQTAAGAANVTDAISMNGKVVGDVVGGLALFVANAVFATGATLRVRQVKAGGDAACQLQIDVVLNGT